MDLINQVNKMPHVPHRQQITQEQFDAILMDPELTVVEKDFYGALECNKVLFVIKDDEIDFVVVKEITGNGTKIYKEI